MRQTIFTCDRCGLQTQETGMVSSVEVTFGGHGAARDKVDGIDLCRGCYSALVAGIRSSTTPNTSGNHKGDQALTDVSNSSGIRNSK